MILEIGLLGVALGGFMGTISSKRRKSKMRIQVELPISVPLPSLQRHSNEGMDDFIQEFTRVSPLAKPLNPSDALKLIAIVKNIEMADEAVRNKIYENKCLVVIPVKLQELNPVAMRCVTFKKDEACVWELLTESLDAEMLFSTFPGPMLQMDGVLYLPGYDKDVCLIIGEHDKFYWHPIYGVEPFSVIKSGN